MSDKPKGAWAYYERLPRPGLRWTCLLGSAWAMGLCDIFEVSLDSTTRGVIFAFAAAVYGLRGWEKLKESPAPETPSWAGLPDPYGGSFGGYTATGGVR